MIFQRLAENFLLLAILKVQPHKDVYMVKEGNKMDENVSGRHDIQHNHIQHNDT
jgi:hypothetical protein